METGPIVSDGGSIDTTTVTIIVTALVSAITGLAGLLYKRLLARESELVKENAQLRVALSAYEKAAPALVSVIEESMRRLEQLSDTSSISGPTSPSASRPLPLPRSSRRRPPR
jgi:hypothetical protein